MDVILRGLGKRFHRDPVLNGIDLDLRPGRIVAVIGLNGAGKTTLLRCLAGAIVPTSGDIRWNGGTSIRDDVDLHRRMMFLPDAPLLMAAQTVLEHIVMHLRAYDREQAVDDREIVALLEELDLVAQCRKPLGKLSRGQRYKASLAALLLVRPELWILDEPFASGMDPQGIQVLKRQARAAAESGKCVIYSTQIIEIAERFCDELLVLDQGRISQRLLGEELRAMAPDGPGSLGERLAAFRDQR